MNVPVSNEPGYRDVIMRLASDPKVDVEKIKQLLDIQEAVERRMADQNFNESHSAAQAEMSQVIKDEFNPQTRKKYASFAALDSEVRPIYTKYGFSIRFDTEPAAEGWITIVGYLAHGKITHRHQITLPVDTKGFQGRAMMTPTHATASAITYGRRYLLIMMFNIAIADEDDDGNKAYPRQPESRYPIPPPAERPPIRPPYDPETGEIAPHAVARLEDEAVGDWAARVLAGIAESATEAEIDRWLKANASATDAIKKEGTELMQSRWDARVNKIRNDVKLKEGGKNGSSNENT